jgi:hypothetical protein
MKIERVKQSCYEPITITLETIEEYNKLINILYRIDDRQSIFNREDCTFSKRLVILLESMKGLVK